MEDGGALVVTAGEAFVVGHAYKADRAGNDRDDLLREHTSVFEGL